MLINKKSINKIRTFLVLVTPLLTAVLLFFASPLQTAEVLKAEVRFTANHPLKTVKGICQDIFIDQLNIKRGNKVGEGYSVKTPVTLVCDVGKMDSGSERRDRDMREALGYPEHKKVLVHLQSITRSKSDIADYIAAGTITIAGKDYSFSSVVHTKEAGEKIEVEGGFSIKLSHFEIEPPSLLGMDVKDDIQIDYGFVFRVKIKPDIKPKEKPKAEP